MTTIMTRSAAEFWWKTQVPRHIIYYYREHPHPEWKQYTTFDEIKKKVQKQNANIAAKRRHTRRVPCLIHVCLKYRSWRVYVITLKASFYLSLTERACHPDILRKLMDGHLFHPEWCDEFCSRHPAIPKGNEDKSGKLYAHCLLDHLNRLIDIQPLKTLKPLWTLNPLNPSNPFNFQFSIFN
jgi:hypothetical protein